MQSAAAIRSLPLIVLIGACSTAALPPTPPPSLHEAQPEAAARSAGEQRYAALVERIKADPQPALLSELRSVLVVTERYQPYAHGTDVFTGPMFDELDDEEWEDCLEHAASALDVDYTDMWAHFGAMICHRESGNPAQAAFHEAVVTGLMDAIAATGNGKTPDTAFQTHSTSELQAFLRLQGWEIEGQALTEPDEDGRLFDVMSVRDPDDGTELTLYFDITLQWALGFPVGTR